MVRVHRLDRVEPDDPRLLEVSGLTDAQARARVDADNGCFVVEGALALEAVAASSHPIRLVLTTDAKLPRVKDLLGDLETDVYVAPAADVEAVTGFAIHRGIVASAARLPLPEVGAVLAAADTGSDLLLVEGVNDHENLGALFRNAAAFGAAAVLLDPTTADPLYRRSVRVSLGHVVHVPWTRTGPLPAGLDALRAGGRRLAALTPGGDVSLHDLDDGAPTTWMVGAEGPGLRSETLAAADVCVRIPIADGVDSLNVATAAAVALSWSTGHRNRSR